MEKGSNKQIKLFSLTYFHLIGSFKSRSGEQEMSLPANSLCLVPKQGCPRRKPLGWDCSSGAVTPQCPGAQGVTPCLPCNEQPISGHTWASHPFRAALCLGLLGLPGSRLGWGDKTLFYCRALHICIAPVCVQSPLCWECLWAGSPQLGWGRAWESPKV